MSEERKQAPWSVRILSVRRVLWLFRQRHAFWLDEFPETVTCCR